MVTGLLDTAVVVDRLRGYAPARFWNRTQSDLGICRAVWMETIDGVENRAKQQIALDLMSGFELVELITDAVIWASQRLITFRLSHGIDPFDCMIASVSHRLHLPRYTRNLKHFTPPTGTLAQAPY